MAITRETINISAHDEKISSVALPNDTFFLHSRDRAEGGRIRGGPAGRSRGPDAGPDHWRRAARAPRGTRRGVIPPHLHPRVQPQQVRVRIFPQQGVVPVSDVAVTSIAFSLVASEDKPSIDRDELPGGVVRPYRIVGWGTVGQRRGARRRLAGRRGRRSRRGTRCRRAVHICVNQKFNHASERMMQEDKAQRNKAWAAG